jgi:hypothetical protein
MLWSAHECWTQDREEMTSIISMVERADFLDALEKLGCKLFALFNVFLIVKVRRAIVKLLLRKAHFIDIVVP